MAALQEYFREQALKDANTRISKIAYPHYWQMVAKAESRREAELAEALTLHDTPCMSY